MEARAAAVTEDEFAALVDRWYGSTVRFARLLAPDETTARRAARDAWLAVIEQLPALQSETTHLVLLRATLESLAARVTAGEPEPTVDAQRFEAEGHRWAGWWTDSGTPQQREHSAPDDELTRALGELDPATAVVVTLRDVEGLSAGEVELVLELTPSDQRRLLTKGRASLWTALS